MDIDDIIPPLESFQHNGKDMDMDMGDNDEFTIPAPNIRLPTPNASPTPLTQPKQVNKPKMWSSVYKKKKKEWSATQIPRMSRYANKYDIGLPKEIKREVNYGFNKGMLCDIFFYFYLYK